MAGTVVVLGNASVPVQGAGRHERLASTSSLRPTANPLATVPIGFEPNRGQAEPGVRFLAHLGDSTVLLTDHSAVLAPSRSGRHAPANRHVLPPITLQWAGAASHAHPLGTSRLPGTVSYFLGSDPRSWHANIPTYARVLYRDIYPGIDLALYGHGSQLEYDWLLHPGANARHIQLRITGSASLRLDPAGNLIVPSPSNAGMVVQHRPLAFQGSQGQRRAVAISYQLVGGDTVRLRLGPYNHHRPLTIDPTLTYSTYLGGTNDDVGEAVAVGLDGSIYLAGGTGSVDFPTMYSLPSRPVGPYSPTAYGFVAKFTPGGGTLEYSTYLGPQGYAFGLAVDPGGDALVVGGAGHDFPQVNALPGSSCGGAFVSRLHFDQISHTLSLVYSSCLGGYQATGVALDASGSVYLSGFTYGYFFPVVHSLLRCPGGDDAFVARLDVDPATNALSRGYSACLGGSDRTEATGIALDRSNNPYIAGNTAATNFPTTDGTVAQGSQSAFLVKFTSGESGTLTIVYSTLLGGKSGYQSANGVAVDNAQNASIVGTTSASDFPTLHAFQPTFGGGRSDTFVATYDATGQRTMTTYLGGTYGDEGYGIAVRNATGIGNECTGQCDIYLAGYTVSYDFPTKDALQPPPPNPPHDGEVFVVRLAASGGMVFGTTVDGHDPRPNYSFYGSANSIAVDPAGNMYVAGDATGGFSTTPGAFQPTYAGPSQADAIVFEIAGSSTTAARIARFIVHRQGSSLRFTWRLAVSTGVIGFDLYAGQRRLNAYTIPTHASPVYHSRVTGTIHGRFTLHVLLRDGRQMSVPLSSGSPPP